MCSGVSLQIPIFSHNSIRLFPISLFTGKMRLRYSSLTKKLTLKSAEIISHFRPLCSLFFSLFFFSTRLPEPVQTNTWLCSDSASLWRATASHWDAGRTQGLDRSNLVRPQINRWNSRSGPVRTALCSNGRLVPGLGDAAAHGVNYKRKKNVEQWKKNTVLFI